MTMPALFVAHGGGPMPLLGDASHSSLITFLSNVGSTIPTPAFILIISAHWEESVPTITRAAKPPLFYDYYGFPEEAYQLQYPAPGAPDVAERVHDLLSAAGFKPKYEDKRGWDHGVFVPLMLMYPQANIPVVVLSLVNTLDPDTHIRMGEALQALRNEGGLIVGSGFTFHNLRLMRSGAEVAKISKEFDNYLVDACTNPEKRKELLINWAKAPHARKCHEREEHLLPLMVVAGAAGNDKGVQTWGDLMLGAYSSSFQFGK